MRIAMRVVAKATRAPIDRCRISMEPGWNRDRTSIITDRHLAMARVAFATARDETARHGTARVVGRDGTRIGT